MSDLTQDSSNKKQRLGRGLGSLLGGAHLDTAPQTVVEDIKSPAPAAVQNTPPEARIWTVSIDKLQTSQFQPRTHFDKVALEELSQSIRVHGILQPIVARRLDSQKLEIIAGERRWRAAQMAGLHEVPVILKTLANKETLELAIIENIQREDLNPIEEANAYHRLLTEFSLTQQQVAEKVGKERATVANSLRLLQLSPAVRNLVAENKLSMGHAKVLLALENASEQNKLAQRVLDESMSVRQLEKTIQNLKSAGTNTKPEASAKNGFDANVMDRLIAGLSEELQKRLGTKVGIDYKAGKGKISIQFYSDEELTQLVERIKNACQ